MDQSLRMNQCQPTRSRPEPLRDRLDQLFLGRSLAIRAMEHTKKRVEVRGLATTLESGCSCCGAGLNARHRDQASVGRLACVASVEVCVIAPWCADRLRSIASDDSRKAQVESPLRPGQKRAAATNILTGAAVRTSTIIPLLKASLRLRSPIIGKARRSGARQ
jgi:hypothetical protein